MDRILTDPRPRAVGANTCGAHDGAEVAVASALHLAVGGLAEYREVAGEEVGAVTREARETVEIGVDLLVVVPHPCDVEPRCDQLGGERELHRDTRLHVDGSAPPEVGGAVDIHFTGGSVAVDRHGIDMSCDHNPLVSPEICPRDDRVALTMNVEVSQIAHRVIDRIGQHALVSRDAGDVADGASQLDRGREQIQLRHAAMLPTGSACSVRALRLASLAQRPVRSTRSLSEERSDETKGARSATGAVDAVTRSLSEERSEATRRGP